MKAVILAGGEGTRLRPYTSVIPKPLLPVGDAPVLQVIIEHLRDHGVGQVIVALGHLGELISSYFGDGGRFGVDISYVHEDKPLGTAGPLLLASDRFEPGELFLVHNGDVLTKLDFSQVVREHDPAHDLSVGVKLVEERSPYGVADIAGGRLRGIVEKPVRRDYVNAGIYLVNQRALDTIPEATMYTMPELVNERLDGGAEVGYFDVGDDWLAVEQPLHLAAAAAELERWAGD